MCEIKDERFQKRSPKKIIQKNTFDKKTKREYEANKTIIDIILGFLFVFNCWYISKYLMLCGIQQCDEHIFYETYLFISCMFSSAKRDSTHAHKQFFDFFLLLTHNVKVGP